MRAWGLLAIDAGLYRHPAWPRAAGLKIRLNEKRPTFHAAGSSNPFHQARSWTERSVRDLATQIDY